MGAIWSWWKSDVSLVQLLAANFLIAGLRMYSGTTDVDSLVNAAFAAGMAWLWYRRGLNE